MTINGLASLASKFLRRHLAVRLGSPMLAVNEPMAVMWAGNRSYRMEPKFPTSSPTANSARSPCWRSW